MVGIKRPRFLGIILCSISTVVLLFYFLGLRINLTGSMPIGLYRKLPRNELHRGDIVSFCLAKPIDFVGKTNGYLGTGPCPGHTTSLLKAVIALPGDKILLSSQSIVVNHHRYFAPQQRVDHHGHQIMHWIKNQKIKKSKTIWVYGSNDPKHSWDSRYFGGIPIENIQGIYEPIWIF